MEIQNNYIRCVCVCVVTARCWVSSSIAFPLIVLRQLSELELAPLARLAGHRAVCLPVSTHTLNPNNAGVIGICYVWAFAHGRWGLEFRFSFLQCESSCPLNQLSFSFEIGSRVAQAGL